MGTNALQPESPNTPSQGVDLFTTSTSQSSWRRQHSGSLSADDIGIPAARWSHTFPPHPGNPQATAPAAPISHGPRGHPTIVIPKYGHGRPAGSDKSTENQDNQGSVITHQHRTQQTVAVGPPSNVSEKFRKRDLARLVVETLPRSIYLFLLFRLPSSYFFRVDSIFLGMKLSMEEIKEMALRDGAADFLVANHGVEYHLFSGTTEGLPPAYLRLKVRWEELINNLVEEWKTLNVISALLLGVIMTMFQIDGAAQDPITRYLAFCSLICALMSLLHGCMFIIRFPAMRKGYRAAEWALEAQRYLNAFWNVWVMLSMPLLWLTWSIITFIVCIMMFMWRSRARLPEDFVFPASSITEISAKVIISVVLGMGVLYTLLIVKTLRRYGSRMDVAWKKRIDGYIESFRREELPTTPPGWPAFSGPWAQNLGGLTEDSSNDQGDAPVQTMP